MIIKKLILIFAAVCLAACTEKTDSPKVSDPSVSYKIDDFEGAAAGDTPPPGWTTTLRNGGDATFTLTADGAQAQGNAYQIFVIKPSDVDFDDVSTSMDGIVVTPGVNNRLSLWLKGDGESRVIFSVTEPDAEPLYWEPPVTADWTQYSFEFIPAVHTVSLAANFSFSSNLGRGIAFDDITIESLPAAPAQPALIFDEPRQANEPAPEWVGQAQQGAKARFAIVDNGVVPDSKALQVNVEKLSDLNRWDIQVFQERISVAPGRVHHYSAWVKGPRGAQLYFGIERRDYSAVANREIITIGDWQQVALAFEPDVPSVRTSIHFSYPHNNNAEIYIDDVRLTQAPER